MTLFLDITNAANFLARNPQGTGVQRVTLDRLAGHVEPAARLGIPALALFPATPTEKKNPAEKIIVIKF